MYCNPFIIPVFPLPHAPLERYTANATAHAFIPNNPLGGIDSKPPLTPSCQGENWTAPGGWGVCGLMESGFIRNTVHQTRTPARRMKTS